MMTDMKSPPKTARTQLPIFQQSISLLSASADLRPKDVGVVPVVISELKLRDIQRHIFGAYLVERANHAAL